MPRFNKPALKHSLSTSFVFLTRLSIAEDVVITSSLAYEPIVMDGMQNKDTKTDNQAWRRKPRKFSPKSRLGCKTCKIRRVKCDLSRPSCLKCRSTGRTCDGYSHSQMPLAFKTEAEKTEIEPSHYYYNGIADRTNTSSCVTDSYTVSAYESKHWHPTQNLGSFMILPVAGPTQAEAMRFFQDTSIKHLNEYRPRESWRNTLMFFSQTVPSVRHAAIALALIHRNYVDRHSNSGTALKDRLPDQAPLLHYNRAIQLLLTPESGSGDSAEITTAVTLLVCYLFICFDHLAGDDVQAVKHLRGGVALSSNIINKATSNSGGDAITYQVTTQIRRLDMQTGIFLVDWTPNNVQEKTLRSPHLALSDKTPWSSLDQAADHLQILLAQVMRLRNTVQQQMSSSIDTMPPLPSSSAKDIILRRLETWSSLFETLLQQQGSSSSPSEPESDVETETDPLISLLRLQHTIAWILLNNSKPGNEMAYDNFLPQFQQCITLANKVTAVHKRYSGSSSRSTFTPEIGFIPVLYIIGAKCRHPKLRRGVLSILRRQLRREASWDSISTARVVERVIEIEESAAAGEVVQCMEQIPVWQRIEVLSFIHIPGGQSAAARLEITYTFCAQDGVHNESLMTE